MTIPEACQLVFQAATMGNGGEIFVFDMGEPVKIYDLAVKMIKLSGLTLDTDIKIVETGLRSGEKLYEELLSNAENTLPTHHPKILIAKVRQYDDDQILPIYSSMNHATFNGATDWEIVKLVRLLSHHRIVEVVLSRSKITCNITKQRNLFFYEIKQIHENCARFFVKNQKHACNETNFH
jgi:FlaA1/EpsC-like NDP-sugar epimerase